MPMTHHLPLTTLKFSLFIFSVLHPRVRIIIINMPHLLIIIELDYFLLNEDYFVRCIMGDWYVSLQGIYYVVSESIGWAT